MVFSRLLVLVSYILIHGLGAGQATALWPDDGTGCCVGQCCCIGTAPTGVSEDGCSLSRYVLSAAPCDGAAPGLPQQDQNGFSHLKPAELIPVSFAPVPRPTILLAGEPTRRAYSIDKVPIFS